MVQPDKISDAQSTVLAHDIAHQIEEEMEYPGQVRVVVIRESRAVDIANNMSDANELISFIASMSGEGNLRVEENLGEGMSASAFRGRAALCKARHSACRGYRHRNAP